MPESVEDLLTELERLRIEEDRIIRRIAELNGSTQSRFKTGDRVRITNSIREYRGPDDRIGTVTRVTPKRVHIRTDSGRHTNRAPKNLKIEEDASQ